MTSWTTLLLLPLSLLALYHSTTTSSAEARQLSSASASERDTDALTLRKRSAGAAREARQHMSLANLLRRRRSFPFHAAGLSAPPRFLNFDEDSVIPSMRKREDEWIWMPAHGYIPMPKDESSSRSDEQDNGIGNLLRYG